LEIFSELLSQYPEQTSSDRSPAKDKSVDLGTRWRGTDRCWFVRDTGKVIPKKSPTKNYINRMKAQ
jgi:hypothetical protein